MVVLLLLALVSAGIDLLLTITGIIAPVDRAVTARVYSIQFGWLTPVMVALTLLGTDPPLFAFAAAVAWLVYRAGDRIDAVVMAAVALVARILAAALKYVVQHPRPLLHPPPHPLTVLYGYGYPSGHAFLSIAILGFGTAVLLQFLAARPVRWLATGLCAVLIIGIGWSRVYLGFHWSNDVLGGYLDGAVVGTSGWVARRRIQLHRRRPV